MKGFIHLIFPSRTMLQDYLCYQAQCYLITTSNTMVLPPFQELGISVFNLHLQGEESDDLPKDIHEWLKDQLMVFFFLWPLFLLLFLFFFLPRLYFPHLYFSLFYFLWLLKTSLVFSHFCFYLSIYLVTVLPYTSHCSVSSYFSRHALW